MDVPRNFHAQGQTRRKKAEDSAPAPLAGGGGAAMDRPCARSSHPLFASAEGLKGVGPGLPARWKSWG
jgi:hypothetical protein